jgi:hypothetical protein
MVHPFGVGDVGCKEKVNETSSKYTARRKSSFLSSSFLQLSSRNSTGVLILSCLNEPNKTAFDVWFYVLIKTSSKTMVFFDHQNKGRPPPHVDVSSLYKGDSNLDHVPLNSPSVPRLTGMHEMTITLQSHCKTGGVVWMLGM